MTIMDRWFDGDGGGGGERERGAARRRRQCSLLLLLLRFADFENDSILILHTSTDTQHRRKRSRGQRRRRNFLIPPPRSLMLSTTLPPNNGVGRGGEAIDRDAVSSFSGSHPPSVSSSSPEQKRGWRRSRTRCQSSADRTPWERESVSREMVCHGARMTERPGDFGVTDFVALGKAGMEGGKLDWKSQGWQNRTFKSFGMVTL